MQAQRSQPVQEANIHLPDPLNKDVGEICHKHEQTAP